MTTIKTYTGFIIGYSEKQGSGVIHVDLSPDFKFTSANLVSASMSTPRPGQSVTFTSSDGKNVEAFK